MAVVRITIKKTLTEGAYTYNRSAAGSFSSEYLVRTEALFPSPLLREYAKDIARAESRLYPACVRFDSALVKLATPGTKAEALRGQYSQVDLDQLCGQLPLEEGEMLAFPPVVAVYSRQAQWGRHGRLLMPHALKMSEWIRYTQKQELPSRYQKPANFDFTFFSYELMEAIRGANAAYVMPGAEGETEESLRKITSFFFDGFEVNTRTPKRRKSSPASKRMAQSSTEMPVEGMVYMLQGEGYFKIGKSVNFTKRLDQIKLQLPYPVKVVHVIRAANPSKVEGYWHRHFAAQRRNGEWFELSESQVEEFKSVDEM